MPITRHNSDWLVAKRKGWACRSWMACSGWIVILATILISMMDSSEAEVNALLALSLAYGVQGCVAELIGVKVEPSGISFPNRAFPRFPYFILFRRRLPAGSFDRIDFVNKRLLIIYPDMNQVYIATTNSDTNTIVRTLRNIFPTVSVKIML